MMILRDKVRHDVSGNIQLVRHGTAHQGPVGQEVRCHIIVTHHHDKIPIIRC